MSTTKCKACGGVVSVRAETCPHCGEPMKRKPRQYGCGTLIVLVIVGYIVYAAVAPVSSPREQMTDEQRVAECRQDLQCWGRTAESRAGPACKRLIADHARHTPRWNDGFLTPAFSRYQWVDQGAGKVRIIGDAVELQNSFGAWTQHIYSCEWDPDSNLVTDVSLEPGRL